MATKLVFAKKTTEFTPNLCECANPLRKTRLLGIDKIVFCGNCLEIISYQKLSKQDYYQELQLPLL